MLLRMLPTLFVMALMAACGTDHCEQACDRAGTICADLVQSDPMVSFDQAQCVSVCEGFEGSVRAATAECVDEAMQCFEADACLADFEIVPRS